MSSTSGPSADIVKQHQHRSKETRSWRCGCFFEMNPHRRNPDKLTGLRAPICHPRPSRTLEWSAPY
eukprot:961031-Rhodomonas_salina.2